MAIHLNSFVFLATPRTASNSLFFSLRELGGKEIDHHHFIPPRQEFPNTQYVASIRNHFDWFVSSWIKTTWRATDKNLQNMPFDRWLTDILTNPSSQLTQFTAPGYVEIGHDKHELFKPLYDQCEVLLSYEMLEKQLAALLQTTPEKLRFPKANRTPHKKPYQAYYTPALIDLVTQHYGAELDKLRYSFDSGREWEPRNDNEPLTGGGIFNEFNQLKPVTKHHGEWKNLKNNPFV
ncbi:MAG: hypothetical protein MI867_19605 [Pseudomonadales bacterium]|nr:hypothetical protein [Pseudomonadales bacterium]